MEMEEILVLIDEDIDFQTQQLHGNFEEDKAINSRIIGMEALKIRIISKKI